MVDNGGVTEFEFVGLLRLRRGGEVEAFCGHLRFKIDFIK